MRERDAVDLAHPEHPHRQPSHRAGDPVAITIERLPVRSTDVLRRIHLHTVDDRQEVRLAQVELARCAREPRQIGWRLPGKQRLDTGAPLRELPAALGAGCLGIRDVIDQTAERVDLVHRLALRSRQDAHRSVERASRRPVRSGRGLRFNGAVRSFIGWRSGGAWCPDQALEQLFGGAECANRGNAELAEPDIFAQRIAMAQQMDETPGERHDCRDFKRKPAVLDLFRQIAAGLKHAAGAAGKAVQTGQQLRRRARSRSSSTLEPALASASSGT